MRMLTFYERVSTAFHDFPSLFKLLVLFTVSGGGLVAYAEANPTTGAFAVASSQSGYKKKVVVLGTGWAGTSFLKNLKNPSYEVQAVSSPNYFAFNPLLPSVTCGTMEARSIVELIRNIVRKQKNVDKIYCQSAQNKNLNGKEEFVMDYDYLVIATGARNCHFLNEVKDAQNIKRAVVDCFEKASQPTVSDEERKRILHFAVVGGGPTGVEFLAELHDFVNEDLVKLYPGVKDIVKITLLEAGGHILNMFDKRITVFT
ncbi:hypothetical protein I3843_01G158300 [Carya illinoinensis]|uniref:NADH:ubiquinone reductase (non-electrogenic) n=1 Tax=Carya illinoinensis TaxID=32201 RepID=A0A922G6P4_CARIL|nr:hypothetical protein I3842_01G165600 [Carya illinoinensis]KAG7996421.1 hypothetical protein I3843_01G158300 [Carya illinoinensis]